VADAIQQQQRETAATQAAFTTGVAKQAGATAWGAVTLAADAVNAPIEGLTLGAYNVGATQRLQARGEGMVEFAKAPVESTFEHFNQREQAIASAEAAGDTWTANEIRGRVGFDLAGMATGVAGTTRLLTRRVQGPKVVTESADGGVAASVDGATGRVFFDTDAEAGSGFAERSATVVVESQQGVAIPIVQDGAASRPGGYVVFDVDEHGLLSPQQNRAPGFQNARSDNFVQSHHPIQDRWAEVNIPGYERNSAPAILLESISGTSHARISAAQRVRRAKSRAQGQDPWATDIRFEFNTSYREMIDAGVPQDVTRRAFRDSYKYFDELGAFKE
jgi:hypothetical protein